MCPCFTIHFTAVLSTFSFLLFQKPSPMKLKWSCIFKWYQDIIEIPLKQFMWEIRTEYIHDLIRTSFTILYNYFLYSKNKFAVKVSRALRTRGSAMAWKIHLFLFIIYFNFSLQYGDSYYNTKLQESNWKLIVSWIDGLCVLSSGVLQSDAPWNWIRALVYWSFDSDPQGSQAKLFNLFTANITRPSGLNLISFQAIPCRRTLK